MPRRESWFEPEPEPEKVSDPTCPWCGRKGVITTLEKAKAIDRAFKNGPLKVLDCQVCGLVDIDLLSKLSGED